MTVSSSSNTETYPVALYQGRPEAVIRETACHTLRLRHLQQYTLSPRLQSLMETSLALIQRSNQLHDASAPAAVILQAASDHNHVLSSTIFLPQLAELAKTHYISIRILNNKANIAATLQEIQQELENRPILTLLIRAHGGSNQLTFSDNHFYAIHDVRAEDFASLDQRASIILFSCLAGQGLAKKIAAVQPRPVFAAMQSINQGFITPCCPTHGQGLFAFTSTGEMMAKRLQRHTESAPCSATESNIRKAKEKLLHIIMATADDGDMIAQSELANAQLFKKYLDQPIETSPSEIVKLTRRAAEQGHIICQRNLAIFYLKGRYVRQSFSEAIKWFERAAEQDNSLPEDTLTVAYWYEELGEAYWYGRGVQQSPSEAIRWWLKAATLGNRIAQNNLGTAYWLGQGAPQSLEEAVKWYTKAATQGNAASQYSLGFAYCNGIGTTQSRIQGLRWLSRAARQGHSDARSLMYQQLRTMASETITSIYTIPSRFITSLFKNIAMQSS